MASTRNIFKAFTNTFYQLTPTSKFALGVTIAIPLVLADMSWEKSKEKKLWVEQANAINQFEDILSRRRTHNTDSKQKMSNEVDSDSQLPRMTK